MRRGWPKRLFMDNGSELTSRHFRTWGVDCKLEPAYIPERQTITERARREFQWQASRRVFKRELVSESVAGSGADEDVDRRA
jgi:hypothetical protein